MCFLVFVQVPIFPLFVCFPSRTFHLLFTFTEKCCLLVKKPQHENDPTFRSSVNIRRTITTIIKRTILVTFGLGWVGSTLLLCSVIAHTENYLRNKAGVRV